RSSRRHGGVTAASRRRHGGVTAASRRRHGGVTAASRRRHDGTASRRRHGAGLQNTCDAHARLSPQCDCQISARCPRGRADPALSLQPRNVSADGESH
ncbi:hypothetical protein P7K49_040831, partial [Saguinus oedipus]